MCGAIHSNAARALAQESLAARASRAADSAITQKAQEEAQEEAQEDRGRRASTSHVF